VIFIAADKSAVDFIIIIIIVVVIVVAVVCIAAVSIVLGAIDSLAREIELIESLHFRATLACHPTRI
jgi:flagellar basal body-associated protein FliL